MAEQSGNIIVAIDGPAASGKSSVARRVAKELGYFYVNSGAMYRAFTWHAVRKGIDCQDPMAVGALLAETKFESDEADGTAAIRVDGDDPGEELSSDAVNANVSFIAAHPAVRERLVAGQRAYAGVGNLVMEGRDIGTVVFPETPYKFYIDASADVRDQRRRAQGLTDDIHDWDRKDSERESSPLMCAEDAVVIDSSHLTLEEVVGRVIDHLRGQGVEAGGDRS